MQQPLATWNSARDAWETPQSVLCGHLDVYSEIWPTSGSMRNGVAYTQEDIPEAHTDVTGSTYLLTPVASEVAKGTFQQGSVRRATTGQVYLINQLRDIYEASTGAGIEGMSNGGSGFTDEPLPLSNWSTGSLAPPQPSGNG